MITKLKERFLTHRTVHLQLVHKLEGKPDNKFKLLEKMDFFKDSINQTTETNSDWRYESKNLFRITPIS